MQKKNQTYRKLKNLEQQIERQIRQVARQIGRCWDLLQKRPNYVEPLLPWDLDIRDMIKVSKM